MASAITASQFNGKEENRYPRLTVDTNKAVCLDAARESDTRKENCSRSSCEFDDRDSDSRKRDRSDSQHVPGDDTVESKDYHSLIEPISPTWDRMISPTSPTISDFHRGSSQSPPCSRLVSGNFGEIYQTLLFFDFDDTLFPTSYLFDTVGLPISPPRDEKLPEDLLQQLIPWRKAFVEYLSTAKRLSGRCVIITNARRPWVSKCIERFVPEAASLVDGHSLDVVYASEVPRKRTKSDRLAPVRYSADQDEEEEHTEMNEFLTRIKRVAMKQEAQKFYSRYPGQTWKNIFGIGDMPYEHDALREVAFTRVSPPRESLRAKAITMRTNPCLDELTLRLRFNEILLPAYIHHDGDLDLDLSALPDPLKSLATALNIPRLAHLHFPAFAWGVGSIPPTEKEVNTALEELLGTIQDEMFTRLCTSKGVDKKDLVRLVSD